MKERKKTVKFLHVKKLRELFDEVAPDENIESSKESRGKIKVTFYVSFKFGAGEL